MLFEMLTYYCIYAIIGNKEKFMLQDLIIKEFIKARKASGLSQKELAQRCGLPQSTIGRIEAGLVVPSVLTIAKIADVLQLEIAVRPKPPEDEQGIV